ncbi:PriCT-2 domain-containing protein [Reyranella sp.]|uniref:PriCT-2 domain-containing protein n=1 Tax=Reyranella sp. TaxID=1929291 RepID=UPI00378432CD
MSAPFDSSQAPTLPDPAALNRAAALATCSPEEARRFLKALDPDARCFTFQTFDDNAERKDPRLAHVYHESLESSSLAYFNDASRGAGAFVTINETNLRGRHAADIVRVRAVFVDLDGAPLEPVRVFDKKPHIIVESSPGRWHAYWLVKDLPLDQFEAVQRALAERFNGDRAVHDLPRVMRLPGFFHRKREPFRTRIVEINDHPPFDGAEFERAAPQVRASGEPQADPARVARALEIIPNDENVDWEKWNRVAMATWGATGGSDEGFDAFDLWSQKSSTYNARDTRERWEAISRSPPSEIGAGTLFHMASRIDPNWERDGVTFDDFHAYMPQHVYLFAPTGDPWPAASINARLPPVRLCNADGSPLLGENGKQVKLAASKWLDQNQAVEQMTWHPGEPQLIKDRLLIDGGVIERRGVTSFNRYKPPTIRHGNPREAQRWVDLVQKVFPQHADHIIRWLAHRVQKPGDKINHALYLAGNPGIGKDTILEPAIEAVGPWNFKDEKPSSLLEPFNPFAAAVILRISEAHDLGDQTRFQFYESTKVYMASPPATLTVNDKYLRKFSVLNCCGVVITSNYKDAIYLPADDRRHYVAWSELTAADFNEAYWNGLYAYYHNGGFGHVAAYLAQLDISSFNPKAPPPKTEAFWDVVDANRSPEGAELDNLLDCVGRNERGEPCRPEALTIEDLIANSIGSFFEWLKDRRNRLAIPRRLKDCGYVRVRNPDATSGLYVVNGARQAIYVKRELSESARLAAASAHASGQRTATASERTAAACG